jgi:hypothetical protein
MTLLNSRKGILFLLLIQWLLYALFTFWPLLIDGLTGIAFLLVGSRGIALYILTFVTLYLLFLVTYGKTERRIITFVGLFLLVSLWAIPFSDGLQLRVSKIGDTPVAKEKELWTPCLAERGIGNFVQCLKSQQHLPQLTLTTQDEFYVGLTFQVFPDKFQRLLKEAQEGRLFLRIRCDLYLMTTDKDVDRSTRLYFDYPGLGESLATFEKTYQRPVHQVKSLAYLSPEDIAFFQKTKKVMLETRAKGAFFFHQRDDQRPPSLYRQDFYVYEGKRHFLRGDGLFLIAFEFETLDHKPVAVFY